MISILLAVLFHSSVRSVAFHFNGGNVRSLSKPNTFVRSSFGLLSDIEDISTASYYTSNMNVSKVKAELSSGTFYDKLTAVLQSEGVEDFDGYLEEATARAKSFILKNQIWDRKELISSLDEIVCDQGNFVCILGGKVTGKSFVLSNLAARHKDAIVIYVDLRMRSPDIPLSTVAAIGSLGDDLKQAMARYFLEFIKTIPLNLLSPLDRYPSLDALLSNLSFFIKPVFTTQYPEEILANLLLSLTTSPKKVTLVIDEANLALSLSTDASEAKVQSIKNTLAKFIALTRQTNKMNVVLVSSEHSFPHRLCDPRIGFNIIDVTKFIFAGEVPPCEMYNLLISQWHLKPKFALALIDLYGGNIFNVYQALKNLSLKDIFEPFDPILTSYVMRCLKPHQKNEVLLLLQLLAQHGFAPLEDLEDPVAKLLSQNNVAGVVKRNALAVGLPRSVWKYHNCQYGLVPSSQSMRLVIAGILT